MQAGYQWVNQLYQIAHRDNASGTLQILPNAKPNQIFKTMKSTAANKPKSRTLISFDLGEVLTPQELSRFRAAAKAAKAKSLTDHFLNLTLRPNGTNPKAA